MGFPETIPNAESNGNDDLSRRPINNGKSSPATEANHRGRSPKQQQNSRPSDGSNGVTGVANTMSAEKPHSFGFRFVNFVVFPFLVMAIMPSVIMSTSYADQHHGGSYLKMARKLSQFPVGRIFMEVWECVGQIDMSTVGLVAAYFGWSIFLMQVLPGRTVKGPITKMGNVPVYKDNGMLCYIVTMVGLLVLTVILKANGSTPTVVYDNFGPLCAFMHLFAFAYVFLMYLKGIHLPSSTDSGKTGNGFIFDYYWGTELYPRICGIDMKVLTNCRFAMTLWPVLVCINALKSYELHGFVDSMFVNTVLQMFYLTKFFSWESEYYTTMDIIQDRAGFYISWGCLAFMCPLYSIASRFLVSHPIHLGPIVSALFLTVGIASTIINYMADRQKTEARETNGNCLIWGKKPSIIRATYRTQAGETKESLLLASGFWGLSRHFHYVPEIILALCWTIPAGFDHIFPYGYIMFLTVLLFHRSFRDDRKCADKYGPYWRQYCSKVKYRIIPYVF